MVTFLITSVLLVGLLAIAIYFWQKPANQTQTIERELPPEHGRSLFADVTAEQSELEAEPELLPPANVLVAVPNRTKADAEALIESFATSPDRNSTLKMLHTAALSDDAATYHNAVEAALRAWREQKLKELSAPDLQALFTSEFWVLSSSTRSSGAGFVLKRALASARRELETSHHNDQPSTGLRLT
jgi:predicted nucleic acid-binding protein